MNNNNKDYYVLYAKGMAETVLWLTGERYITFKPDNYDGYVYSFKNTKAVRDAVNTLYRTRAKLRPDNISDK